MPFFLGETTARDLSGLISTDKKKPQISPALPKHESLYNILLEAVVVEDWAPFDSHLGWHSKLRLFRSDYNLDKKLYPVYSRGGYNADDTNQSTPPPYVRGVPVLVCWRSGFTILGLIGGHIIGIIIEDFTQNERGDAEALVQIPTPIIGQPYYRYSVRVPFLRPKQTLKANKKVAVSINAATLRMEIIAGEC